jgi:hypothetical protein
MLILPVMMRLFTTIVSLIFCFSAASQMRLQLILKNAGGHKIQKVDVFDLSQKEIYEAPYQDTLVFKFKKKNIDCYNIRYHEQGKMFRQQIWLDTGSINIEAHIAGDDLIIDTVVNSPFFYAAAVFNKQYADLAKTQDTIAINNFLLASFQHHFDNPFSINVGFYYLMWNQNQKQNLLNFKSLADRQGEKFSWFLLYPMVMGRVNKILSLDRVNLSNYSFIDKANKRVKLSLGGSDYYVFDFWFLACLPCVEQHVEIRQKISQLKARKVSLIGIATDSDVRKWKNYLDKHGYDWQNFLQDQNASITKDLSISSFPTYIILNNAGDIINTYNSFSDVLKRFQIED